MDAAFKTLTSPVVLAGRGMLTDCGPLKFRIDQCNILLHVIELCIENKKRFKILFKQRSQQLIETLILGGKTTIVRRTLQFNSPKLSHFSFVRFV